MEFVVEAVSPTRKKITFSLTAADVNAAITKVANDYRKDLALPGFRKGKVPISVVEHRFGDEIRSRAMFDTVEDIAKEAMAKENFTALSQMDMDNKGIFEKNTPFACSMQCDVLPEIDLPPYEGLEVEQETPNVTDADVDALLLDMRNSMAQESDVTEDRLPQDGDAVIVDYDGVEPDDPTQPVKYAKGEHLYCVLGMKQVIDDFEALIKTAKVGEEKEGIVTFPPDYFETSLQGKKVLFRIKITSLKARTVPELDDNFAQKVKQENVAKLRQWVREQFLLNKVREVHLDTRKKLLDQLLPKVNIDVPETMLNLRIEHILGDREMRLRQFGKTLKDTGRPLEELREEAKAEALESLRAEVFLMVLAKKEHLTISDEDVQMRIYQIAANAQQDYKKLLEFYYKTGMYREVADQLLATKAWELLYDKAKIKKIGEEAVEKPAE